MEDINIKYSNYIKKEIDKAKIDINKKLYLFRNNKILIITDKIYNPILDELSYAYIETLEKLNKIYQSINLVNFTKFEDVSITTILESNAVEIAKYLLYIEYLNGILIKNTQY